jgi:hypothetical protein
LGMKILDGGDNITPIRAVLIRHTRLRFADGGLIEVKLCDFLKDVARWREKR